MKLSKNSLMTERPRSETLKKNRFSISNAENWVFVQMLEIFRTKTLQSENRPILSKEEINSICCEIENGKTQYECVIEVSHFFNYNQFFFKDLLNQEINEEVIKTNFIYNLIGFFSKKKLDNVVYDLEIILDCFKKVFLNELEPHFILCFYLIIVHIIKLNYFKFEEIYKSIKMLFNEMDFNKIRTFQVIPIFESFLSISVNVNYKQFQMDIIDRFMKFLSHNKLLSESDFLKIIKICHQGIEQLNPKYIEFFVFVSQLKVNKYSILTYEHLPELILCELQDEIKEEDYSLPKLNISFTRSKLNVIKPLYLKNDILLNLKEYKFETICLSKYLLNLYNVLKPILRIQNQQYLLEFYSSFKVYIEENINSNSIVELISFFIYSIEPVFEESECIYNYFKIIFDHNYTIFRNENKTLNKLREFIFEKSIDKFQEQLESIISHSQEFPFLFCEHIARLFNKKETIDIDKIITKRVISGIGLNLRVLLDMDGIESKNAWSILYSFTLYILNFDAISHIAFDDEIFSVSFLSLIAQDSFKDYIYKYMINFSKKTKNTFSILFFLDKLFETNENKILLEFLSKLIPILQINNSQFVIKNNFVEMLHKATTNFIKNPEPDLFPIILNFFSILILNDFHFNDNEIKKLSSILPKFPQDDGCFLSLLSMLSKTKIENFTTNILIKEDNIINLILSYKGLENTLNFLYSACKFSSFNYKKCHRSQIDVLMIDIIINKDKKEIDFSGIKINIENINSKTINSLIFPFLTGIIANFTTPSLISKLFGFFMIPTFDPDIPISILEKSINECSKVKVFYDFKDKKPFVNYSIQSEDISRFSFTVNFYVDIPFLSSISCQPLLLSISDENYSSIIIFQDKYNIYAQIQSMNYTSLITLSEECPNCKWTTLTFIFNPISDKLGDIYYSIGFNNLIHQSTVNPNLTGNLKIKIGSFLNDSHEDLVRHSMMLGPFSIVNTVLENKRKNYYLQSLKEISLPNFHEKLKSICNKNNLIDIMAMNQIYDIFIPFFKILSKFSQMFIIKLISIFSFFQDFDNYSFLSNLILSNDDFSFLTYQMYLQFFNIFDSIRSINILKYILFNFEIWSKVDKTYLKVLNHIHQELFVEYPNEIFKNIEFSKLVTSFMKYFGNIEEIKKQQKEIILEYFSLGFRKNDLDFIISLLPAYNDNDKLIFLIDTFGAMKEITNIDFLFCMFSKGSSEVICETLKIISLKSPIYSTCSTYFLSQKNTTPELFFNLYKIVEQYPSLIITLSMIAFNLYEKKYLEMLLEKMEIFSINNSLLSSVSKSDLWFIWPILAILKMEPEKQLKGAIFIHCVLLNEKNIQLVDLVFCFLDIVSIDSTYFKFSLSLLLCNNNCDNNYGKIAFHCFNTIFFSTHYSNLLDSFYKESPFYENNEITNNIKKQNFISAKSISELFENAQKMIPVFSFKIIIDCNNELLMKPLFKKFSSFLKENRGKMNEEITNISIRLLKYFRTRANISIDKMSTELNYIYDIMPTLYTDLSDYYNGNHLNLIKYCSTHIKAIESKIQKIIPLI